MPQLLPASSDLFPGAGCCLSPAFLRRFMLGLLGSEATAGTFSGMASPLLLSPQPLVGLPDPAVPGRGCPLPEFPAEQVSAGVDCH